MTPSLPLVLITHTLPTPWLATLEGRCRCLAGPQDATHWDGGLWQALPEADGLLTLLTIPVDQAVLARSPRLRVVSNMAVGYDNIDVAACTRRGIAVGNTPGVLTEATADLTMTLLLAAARRLPQAAADAKAGRWKTWSPTGWLGADLTGATLGVIGLGKIGQAVARRAHAFGLQLIYFDHHRKPEVERQLPIAHHPLDDLLAASDFVSLHTPLTPATDGLIDAAHLRRMKPSAILVNTSRGGVINQADLAQALEQGWIAAAALDVTTPEPLPPDHPLYQLPNCLIAPHIGSATQATRRRMAQLACDNLLAGLDGRPLPYPVNQV